MHVAKKYQFCVCLVSMVFISIYCSTPPANDGKIVIASIAPIADIAHNISGNVLKIITVIPPNANPHTYEITPSDAKLLKSAAIFVGIHPNFDGWISKMIPPSAKLIYLSELIKGNNPHVWLSVKNTTRIAAAIRDFFSSLYPQHAHLFEKNYTAYRQKLDVLDNRIHNILSSVPHKKLIQWHPAWDYFARDYGLTIAGTIES
ncbi:MAG: metal ABC transporter substrate-binding protein, partial [Spirochaetes bacterium]|nr:metal ABC transporter substrate-binding protein [Spirochaetota bacterium]